MKWCCLSLPALALLLSACATGSSEVIRFGDGVWRAPTHVDAQSYCKQKDSTVRVLGKAPGEGGVLFRCN
ncbi:MAG: hypothetical protein EOO26_16400 [Comamonadaceae bacterium]|nr:MAG: hypothetical protein EOO26_16400 [Comamonadaceae bacterium]